MASRMREVSAALERMSLLKAVLAVALTAGMAVSPRLWITDRPFPTVPVYPWIPDLPQPLCVAMAVLLAVSAGVVAVHPRPGRLPLMTLGLALGLVAFDINRLQPWLVEYLPMLGALTLVDWDDSESPRSKAAWGICATVVIGVYVWSGLQKLNVGFAQEVFPWLLHPLGSDAVGRLGPFWPVAPLVETGIGLLLLLPKTRPWGVGGAVLLHALLLALLGPMGQNYDSIVWPWNVAAAALAFVLFRGNDQPVLRAAWASTWGKGALVLFGTMPLLNFFNLWDGFLSASLYSGKLRDGWIYLTEEGARHLPPDYTRGNEGFTQEMPNRYRLDIMRWSMSRLNAPPYAEPRFYAGLVRKLERVGVPPGEMTLLVRDPPKLTEKVDSVSPFPAP